MAVSVRAKPSSGVSWDSWLIPSGPLSIGTAVEEGAAVVEAGIAAAEVEGMEVILV